MVVMSSVGGFAACGGEGATDPPVAGDDLRARAVAAGLALDACYASRMGWISEEEFQDFAAGLLQRRVVVRLLVDLVLDDLLREGVVIASVQGLYSGK